MRDRKSILAILLGGTVCQVESEKGLIPSDEPYLHLVPNLSNICHFDSINLGAIDSTEMNASHRISLAESIKKFYNNFDGFVVVQGTDTLVDSACAINYMVHNLGKPIVFTGSQIPIRKEGTDAIRNLSNAFLTATKDVGETVIVFGDNLVRGSRAKKVDERGFNAFDSPNYSLLGNFKENFSIINKNIFPRQESSPSFHINLDPSIEYFHQVSGSNYNSLEKLVGDPKLNGFVIGGFGAGNIHPKYAMALEKAKKLNKPVVVVTSCEKGFADIGDYSINNHALNSGVISGFDLTPEAACQKLMYALSLARCTPGYSKVDFVKQIIQRPVRGDITIEKQ